MLDGGKKKAHAAFRAFLDRLEQSQEIIDWNDAAHELWELSNQYHSSLPDELKARINYFMELTDTRGAEAVPAPATQVTALAGEAVSATAAVSGGISAGAVVAIVIAAILLAAGGIAFYTVSTTSVLTFYNENCEPFQIPEAAVAGVRVLDHVSGPNPVTPGSASLSTVPTAIQLHMDASRQGVLVMYGSVYGASTPEYEIAFGASLSGLRVDAVDIRGYPDYTVLMDADRTISVAC